MNYKMKLVPYKENNERGDVNTTPYGIKMIKADKFWAKSHEGAGVTIAIIDSGCDINHEALKDKIFHKRNFTKDDGGKVDIVTDYVGHGTHVAGIISAESKLTSIRGVAPKSKLIILKAIDKTGTGEYKWIVNAINYAVKQRVDIISMSLGGFKDDENLHNAIKKAISSNILVVCASGNDGDGNYSTNEYSYPASYSEVISVGAVDKKGNPAYFSNSNNLIDIMAPGVGILSTFKDGKYAVLDGTSMAAPHISGALALIKNYSEGEFQRTLSESELYAQLIKYTIDLNHEKKIQGNGLIYLVSKKQPRKIFK